MDTHATRIGCSDGTVTVTRWYYRQRTEAVVRRTARPWIIVVESGGAEPWAGAAGSARVEAVAVTLGEARDVAKVAAAIAREIARYNRPVPRPARTRLSPAHWGT